MSELLSVSVKAVKDYAMIVLSQVVVYVYEELVPEEGDETGLKLVPNGRVIVDIERRDKPEPADPLVVRVDDEIILELN